jgi:hypothetical protein
MNHLPEGSAGTCQEMVSPRSRLDLPFRLSMLSGNDSCTEEELDLLTPSKEVIHIVNSNPTPSEVDNLFLSALDTPLSTSGSVSVHKVTQLVLDIHFFLKSIPTENLSEAATTAAQEICERALRAYIREGDHRLLKSGEWYENKVNEARNSN